MNLAALLPLLRAAIAGNLFPRTYIPAAMMVLLGIGIATGKLTPEQASQVTIVAPEASGMGAEPLPVPTAAYDQEQALADSLKGLTEALGAGLGLLGAGLGFLRSAVTKHGKGT